MGNGSLVPLTEKGTSGDVPFFVVFMELGCGVFLSSDPSVTKVAKIRREPSDFSRLFRQLSSEEGSPFSLRPLMIRHITYPFHLNVPSAVRLRARGQMASLL